MFPTCEVGNFKLCGPAALWEMPYMDDGDELEGERLYDAFMAIKPDGLAETEWAAAAGVNRGWFGNLKTKSKNPRRDTVRKVLSFIGKTEADLRNDAPPAPKPGGRVTHVTADQPIVRTIDAGETVKIVRLDLSLPMGSGATVDDYIEEEPFEFDLAYVRSFTRTPPARLRLAQGVGDSMMPTLNSYDLVWIDSTQTELNQSDRVWAVSINGAAAIKRLRPLKGGRVMVISDNQTIGNYEVDRDEIIIGGRVIRFARDL